MDAAAPAAPTSIGGYPARRHTLAVGGLRISLLLVDRLEDYVERTALLRDAGAPEPPYWAHLWPGSRALARLVAGEVDCAGRRVVDAGRGVGLAGIAAALRGAVVTAVDAAAAALHFTRANAALNGCRLHVVQADLCRPALRAAYDYCLAADVTYDPSLQTALAHFLAARLAPGGRAWCAESVRTFDQGLRQTCERLGLQVSEREVHEADEGRQVPVRITEVARPGF